MQSRFVPCLAIAASTFAISINLTGCDDRSHATRGQQNALYHTGGDKVPVYIKMRDNSLFLVEQSGNEVHFYKTATGYGDSGGGGSIAGIGGGITTATGNLYTKLEPLSALGYFKNDWRTIYNAVQKQSGNVANSVEPELVRAVLEGLTTTTPLYDEPSYPRPISEARMRKIYETDKAQWLRLNNYNAVPVHILLDDGTMLMVTETVSTPIINGYYEVRSVPLFFKTSSGYSRVTVGGSANPGNVGVSAEATFAVSEQYDQITALEALAFVDGEISKITGPVTRQSRILGQSVDPKMIQDIFDGLKKGIPQQIREQQQNRR